MRMLSESGTPVRVKRRKTDESSFGAHRQSRLQRRRLRPKVDGVPLHPGAALAAGFGPPDRFPHGFRRHGPHLLVAALVAMHEEQRHLPRAAAERRHLCAPGKSWNPFNA